MNSIVRFFLIIISVIGIAVTVSIITSKIFNLPIEITSVINTVLIATVGIVVVTLVSRLIKSKAGTWVGRTTANSLSFVIQFLGYVIIVIIALTSINVGVTSAVFGGTVLGLVVGLALQTSLSNIFSGIFIILSRPFKIGDRVTILTWQYGLLAPWYPPKFFSNDFLIPGHTGVVVDVGLMYTTIITDENVKMKIPNNIMIQAAVFQHDEEYRLVRTKYEVSKDLDPDILIPVLEERLSKLEFMVNRPIIKVLDTTFNTYIIVVDAYCKGQYEEPPRSEIIKIIMKTVKELQKQRITERDSTRQ